MYNANGGHVVELTHYDSQTDLAAAESGLLDEVNNQITQDLINKLMSNW